MLLAVPGVVVCLRAWAAVTCFLFPAAWGRPLQALGTWEQPRPTDQPVAIDAQGTWMRLTVLLVICNPVSLASSGTFGSWRVSEEPGADISMLCLHNDDNKHKS